MLTPPEAKSLSHVFGRLKFGTACATISRMISRSLLSARRLRGGNTALALLATSLCLLGPSSKGHAQEATPASQATAAPAAGTNAPASRPADSALSQKEISPLLEGESTGLGWRVLASVVVILVLGAAAFVVLRKLSPRIGIRRGRELAIVETIYVGPKRAVHLLQVGNRRFLLGSQREGVSMLAEVTEPLAAEPGPGPAQP